MNPTTLSFNDTETAFAAKSDRDLQRAYWLFKLISYNWLVRISPPFVHTALRLHLPVKGLIRNTIFEHFCGGEDVTSCETTIRRLHEFGIGTILDYSVEGKENETDFDSTLEETLTTIRRAKGDPSIPFTVFKPSGIARTALLQKMNDKQSLTAEEQQEMNRYHNRFESICKTAFENDVRVFIDAEEFSIQHAIDEMAMEMMGKYNKEKAIVFNTLQFYRHDRLAYLKKSLEESIAGSFHLGLKLVRGAYMEKERLRAAQRGYASPIQSDKSATDRDYDNALELCINHISHVAFCAGTHNEKSSLSLTRLISEKGLDRDDARIWFSQLYGMSDHISYNLAKAGYNVCKYVPYGPVTAVLPYLIRRAQENTSVAGQTGRELSLILSERKRRRG